MRIAITGATGFIGSELVRELLLDSSVEKLYLLIRPHTGAAPADRWEKVLSHWKKFAPTVPSDLSKIEIIECDLEKPGVEDTVVPVFDYFIHSAASTDFHLPLGVARTLNLHTTQRAAEIARKSPLLKRFVYMSTAFVSGASAGHISEDFIPNRFSNTYEKTKMEAEGCVRSSGLPWTILRPSIVVGHSENGYVWRMKVIYSVTKIWVRGFVTRAPMDREALADVVPVDFVTMAAISLMKSNLTLGRSFHLCSGKKAPRSFDILMCAAKAFGIKNPKTSPLWYARVLAKLPSPKLLIGERLASILDAMQWHLPYLGTRDREFDTIAADDILKTAGISCPDFSHYGRILFEYCRKTQWGRRPLRSPAKHLLDEVVGVQTLSNDLNESERNLVYN